MTDSELKNLSRAELLELLISVTKENDALRAEVAELETKLEDRTIKIDRAGSIAEAALRLNGVFEAAEAAAGQYLASIRQHEVVYDKMDRAAQARAAQILSEAKKKAAQIEADSIRKADDYWSSMSARLDSFYSEHKGLREFLDSLPNKSDT